MAINSGLRVFHHCRSEMKLIGCFIIFIKVINFCFHLPRVKCNIISGLWTTVNLTHAYFILHFPFFFSFGSLINFYFHGGTDDVFICLFLIYQIAWHKVPFFEFRKLKILNSENLIFLRWRKSINCVPQYNFECVQMECSTLNWFSIFHGILFCLYCNENWLHSMISSNRIT